MDKVSYALGMHMASHIINSGLKRIEMDAFTEAFSQMIQGKPMKISPEEAQQVMQDFFAKQRQESASINLEAGKRFLEENKKKNGVVALSNGMQYEVIEEGSGSKPSLTDRVRVHYEGTLIDGTIFDSSVQRGESAVFQLNQVILGWQEGLQLMSEGARWRFYIPPHLAYGERGAGEVIGPNATLIFDVQLLSIEK